MTNGRAKPPAGGRAKPMPTRAAGLHPRNRHQGRYDLDALLALAPTLARHLVRTPVGERSIDFAHPEAVRTLNAALLELHYGVRHWQLPAGYLCPPVPGRADYLHGLADLLAADAGGTPPRGAAVRMLDVGCGANLVYPLIGHADYGWTFVGSDVDAEALAIGTRTLAHNPTFAEAITLRLQPQRNDLFRGVIRPGERFAASLCNPPFHASAAEAAQGSARKWRNLGKPAGARGAPRLNFGGHSNELWCRGGEAGFLERMAAESATLPDTVGWYTSLVAKAEHLPALRQQLARLGAREVREQRMAQGNKQSRFLAWSFLAAAQRAALARSG